MRIVGAIGLAVNVVALLLLRSGDEHPTVGGQDPAEVGVRLQRGDDPVQAQRDHAGADPHHAALLVYALPDQPRAADLGERGQANSTRERMIVMAGSTPHPDSRPFGGARHALLRPVVGIDNVARLLAVGWWERDAERSTELVQINGGPGLLVRVDGEIDAVVAVRVENGYVTGAYHVRNPEKLSRVERETAGGGRQGGPEAPVRLAGNLGALPYAHPGVGHSGVARPVHHPIRDPVHPVRPAVPLRTQREGGVGRAV